MVLEKNKNAIIWGAGSGVGRALANYLASLNYSLLLISRSERDLAAVSNNILNKYAIEIKYLTLDINRDNEIESFFKTTDINFFDELYITIGKVNDFDNGEQEDEVVEELINSNFTSPVRLINRIISSFNYKKQLKLLVVSSIAISRARKNNIVYSSAKMGYDFYCQALQHKFNATNLSISICRLGYTDTEMAFGKSLLFPVAETSMVARKFQIALTKNRRLFYIPGFWKLIHLIINSIPWPIYKRINF